VSLNFSLSVRHINWWSLGWNANAKKTNSSGGRLRQFASLTRCPLKSSS
jgi:hypothetical protein